MLQYSAKPEIAQKTLVEPNILETSFLCCSPPVVTEASIKFPKAKVRKDNVRQLKLATKFKTSKITKV